MRKKLMMLVLVTLTVACAGMAADEEVSVAYLKRKIAAKEAEKRKIDKENPCVVYAEMDNPSINVRKTMDRRDGKYPRGVTELNQRFFCPIHKKDTPCFKYMGGWDWCKKGNFARVQWMNMKRKINKTAECDKKAEEILKEISELNDRLELAKEREKAAKAKAREAKEK